MSDRYTTRSPADGGTDRPTPDPQQGSEGPDEVGGPIERPRAPGWLPWALAIVGFSLAVASIGLWTAGVPGGERDREQAAQVASQTVVALTNWRADELGEVRATVEELGTERLQEEAEQIIGEFEEALATAGAESEGEVIDLVAEVGAESGIALAVLRQELTVAEVGTTSTFCWAVRVTVVEQDGDWLADTLDLIGPGECPTD